MSIRFNVHAAATKSVSTPLAAHFIILCAKSCPNSEEERKQMVDISFANLVGGLMDIAQAIGVVS